MDLCLRCQTALDDVTPEEVKEIQFLSCPACGSSYSRKPGQALHDRWLMPITLPLYEVIFERDPPLYVDKLIERNQETGFDPYKKMGSERVQVMIEHIRDELDQPKQSVSEIHDYVCADEAKLREYLRQLLGWLQDRYPA